jgi:hydrogenase/urease accessory protein HupE
MRFFFRALFFALLCVLAARPVSAHGLRTAYVELSEMPGGVVLATVRTAYPDTSVDLGFPSTCTRDDAPSKMSDTHRAFSVRCPGGLSGRTISVSGLGPIHTEAVVRIIGSSGKVRAEVLTPEHATWNVPAQDSWTQTGVRYAGLGVKHVLTGFDHLLFLLGLLLYVRRIRTLLVTETAFTLSHSLTFSLSALGIVSISAPAVEACIALSLVLVALDVGVRQPERQVRWQGPLLALVFGLVHGLGFAGGLAEMGMPDQAIASALVGFGFGVEIGQLAFLAAALVFLYVARRLSVSLHRTLARAGTYAIGAAGSFWLFQRVWVLLAS